jgi:hypothetical protein
MVAPDFCFELPKKFSGILRKMGGSARFPPPNSTRDLTPLRGRLANAHTTPLVVAELFCGPPEMAGLAKTADVAVDVGTATHKWYDVIRKVASVWTPCSAVPAQGLGC